MKRYLNNLPLVIILLLGLTPLIWFIGRGNVLINGVDTNFPLDPANWFFRRMFVWNSIPNGGIDFSSSTSGLFFHFLQFLPYKLGLDLQTVQIFSLVIWFLLIVFAAFSFARTFLPKSFSAQILFTILYAFNIYLFNTWENVKVANLSLVAAVPLALAILQKLKTGKINRKLAAFYSLFIGIIASGTGINPSYFISFNLVLLLFFIGGLIDNFKLLKNRLKDLIVVIATILLINCFWILPTANYIYQNISIQGSIDKIGFTNWIDSLSANTSILNITRLQGAWDWYSIDSQTGNALYIPYATNYFTKLPFIVFSFLLPLLAIASFITRKKDREDLYISFGLMMVIGIFLGAGTHLPTGVFFSWLYYHVPFFTLFRSPWYIFTPLLLIAFSALISLFFYSLKDKITEAKFKYKNIFLPITITFLIIGNLIYSYPLIQGKIFRPASSNSFFVNFPSYVFETSKWLSTQNNGRIIGYPDDEIEKFHWGYIGIESILSLISDQETLFSPLNAPNNYIAELIKNFYKNLKEKKMDSVLAIASKLNAGVVFEKKDQQSLSRQLPDDFRPFLSKSIGPWNFYELSKDLTLPKIYTSSDLYLVYPYQSGAIVSGVLPSKTSLINPDDKIINNNSQIVTSSSKIIYAKNSHLEEFKNYQLLPSLLSERLQSRDLSRVSFNFEVPEDGLYQPIMEKYSLEDFGFELSKGLDIELDGKDITWQVSSINGSYIYLNPVSLTKGVHIGVMKLINNNLVFGSDISQGFKESGYGSGRSEYRILEEGKDKILSISNMGKADASADYIVRSFDPFAKYYVEIKYRQIYGNNATATISQYNKNTLFKAQIERMPNHPEWKVFSFYYEPVNTDSNMKVSLNAPFTSDPLGTKILYNDLKVYKLFSNNLFLMKRNNINTLTAPIINFKKTSPVLYEGSVENNIGPHIIVFSENYSPDWTIALQRDDGQKIDLKPDHFSVNFYANAWFVDNIVGPYKLKIWYKPQSLLIGGWIISLLTTVLVSLVAFTRINLFRRTK